MTHDASEPDTHDEFLDPEPAEFVSWIRHPDEIGEGWHPCRDFIDPLVARLEKWRRKPKDRIDDLEDLKDLEGLLYGWGYKDEVGAFDRAMAWLHVRRLDNVRRSIRRRIRNIAQKSMALECRLEPPGSSKFKAESWRGQFLVFEISVIEPFVRYLRNLKLELDTRFPPGPPPAAKPEQGEGDGGATLARRSNAPPKKGKVGRPLGKFKPETIRRAKFGRPLRDQGKKWPEIHAAYHKKYPKDLEASADTIRLACKRQQPK